MSAALRFLPKQSAWDSLKFTRLSIAERALGSTAAILDCSDPLLGGSSEQTRCCHVLAAGVPSSNRFRTAAAATTRATTHHTQQQVRCVSSRVTKKFMDFVDDDVDPAASSAGEGLDDDELLEKQERDELEREKQMQKKEFENKKGRGWSDSMDMEKVFEANLKLADLPEWSVDSVSDISRNRVQIHPDKIPTLSQLAHLPLPPPPYAHPGHGNPKAYTAHRRRTLYNQVSQAVRAKAAPDITKIQHMETWDDKQEAVDKLFEDVERTLQKEMDVLGRHPQFATWVETALEEYLMEVDETSKTTLYQQVAASVRSRAAPQVEHIESLGTASLAAQQDAAARLFDSVSSSSVTDATTAVANHRAHPLFGFWVEKALEQYLKELKDEAEQKLHELVKEAVQPAAASSLADIETLENDEEKAASIDDLSNKIKQQLDGKEFEAKRYNFTRWLKKTHEDSLYQRVAAAVREEGASLSLEGVQDMDAQRRVVQLQAKMIKEKLDTQGFPLAKHGTCANWVNRALEEYMDDSRKGQFEQVAAAVTPKVEAQVDRIQALNSLSEKWTAVDEFAKTIKDELVAEKFGLSEHYQLDAWIKKAVKDHLQQESKVLPESGSEFLDETTAAPLFMIKQAIEEQLSEMEKAKAAEPFPTPEEDERAVPVFMDVYGPECNDDHNVPNILYPLKFYARTSHEQGRMIEEWELAAHKETKRIMLRESTRQIAQAMEESERTRTPCRILVHGRQGVGKTAALAAIVASARTSGHIVLYMPDSRYLHEHGFYNVKNRLRKGLFDLPVLAQSQCKIMLDAHRDDLEGMTIGRDRFAKYFAEKRAEQIGESATLIHLLELALEKAAVASGCYSAVMEALMTQEEKPFTMVVDEFNVFFGERGHYYNELYDPSVQTTIPYNRLTLFKPMLDAMGLTVQDDGEKVLTPTLMKRGCIVAATSESHAVPRKSTNWLLDNAKRATEEPTAPLKITEIPRLSKLELEHLLSNYECTGVGNLRLDKGEIVTNPQEVEYLRMVSSANPHKLMNAIIVPY